MHISIVIMKIFELPDDIIIYVLGTFLQAIDLHDLYEYMLYDRNQRRELRRICNLPYFHIMDIDVEYRPIMCRVKAYSSYISFHGVNIQYSHSFFHHNQYKMDLKRENVCKRFMKWVRCTPIVYAVESDERNVKIRNKIDCKQCRIEWINDKSFYGCYRIQLCWKCSFCKI